MWLNLTGLKSNAPTDPTTILCVQGMIPISVLLQLAHAKAQCYLLALINCATLKWLYDLLKSSKIRAKVSHVQSTPSWRLGPTCISLITTVASCHSLLLKDLNRAIMPKIFTIHWLPKSFQLIASDLILQQIILTYSTFYFYQHIIYIAEDGALMNFP